MLLRILVACALLVYAAAAVDAQRGRGGAPPPAAPQGRGQASPASQRPPQTATPQQFPPEQVEAGRTRFASQCGFCHGRDAGGGEGGPDLTRSELVAADIRGDRIAPVVRSGRQNMPGFALSDADMAAIVAFIHDQKTQAESAVGGRRSVDLADLQTGNADAGKRYFDAACSRCHSATGDLAGVATRLQGLPLLQRMLYPNPRRTPPLVTVLLAPGQDNIDARQVETVTGTLAYRDEFTIALRDQAGRYRSWPTNQVRFTVEDPLERHVEQLGKYTDADMHDVLAYLQTLR